MKIKMTMDNRTYTGTPGEIVNKLSADAGFMVFIDIDDYMKKVMNRLHNEERADIEIKGATREERCESFIVGLIISGLAEIIVERNNFDQYTIRTIRKIHRLTQEDFARRIGVAYTSVNRWEKGKHLPRTRPIIEKLQDITKGAVGV